MACMFEVSDEVLGSLFDMSFLICVCNSCICNQEVVRWRSTARAFSGGLQLDQSGAEKFKFRSSGEDLDWSVPILVAVAGVIPCVPRSLWRNRYPRGVTVHSEASNAKQHLRGFWDAQRGKCHASATNSHALSCNGEVASL